VKKKTSKVPKIYIKTIKSSKDSFPGGLQTFDQTKVDLWGEINITLADLVGSKLVSPPAINHTLTEGVSVDLIHLCP
jgi:hypothetical protein